MHLQYLYCGYFVHLFVKQASVLKNTLAKLISNEQWTPTCSRWNLCQVEGAEYPGGLSSRGGAARGQFHCA